MDNLGDKDLFYLLRDFLLANTGVYKIVEDSKQVYKFDDLQISEEHREIYGWFNVGAYGMKTDIINVVTTDANSLLVNFGAIFTALLLSVLVLVYDQGEKLRCVKTDQTQSHNIELKKDLLEQLYFNICYAIVVSVALVFLCLVYTFLPDTNCILSFSKLSISLDIKLYVASPLVLIVVMNLLLTILMVVKRMHTLLTIKI